MRLFGDRVHHRREHVQHEDHGRHQAWHEADRGRPGPPSAQDPRAEGRPGGGV